MTGELLNITQKFLQLARGAKLAKRFPFSLVRMGLMKIDLLFLLWLTMPMLFIGGLLIGRSYSPGAKRIKTLKAEIEHTQADLQKTKMELDQIRAALELSQGMSDEYRQQVTKHFSKTAELVNNLTMNYRAVYEHLATSALSLCDEEVAILTDAVPGERLLSQNTAETNPQDEPPSKGSKLPSG